MKIWLVKPWASGWFTATQKLVLGLAPCQGSFHLYSLHGLNYGWLSYTLGCKLVTYNKFFCGGFTSFLAFEGSTPDGLSGILSLRQHEGDPLAVSGVLEGSVGRGLYGLHVHESPDLSNGCNGTGHHFNVGSNQSRDKSMNAPITQPPRPGQKAEPAINKNTIWRSLGFLKA